MNFPVVQIQQQYAKIGFDADLGKYSIKQPRPDFQIDTVQANLDTRYIRGEQHIDQSPAREALGKGGIHHFIGRIASEGRSVALEGIARRASDGDQMTQIHTGVDVIAQLAYNSAFRDYKINYEGPFTNSNYHIEYKPNKPESNFTPGSVDVNAKVNPPIIEYHRGKMDIYMRQNPSIQFIPPEIDIQA